MQSVRSVPVTSGSLTPNSVATPQLYPIQSSVVELVNNNSIIPKQLQDQYYENEILRAKTRYPNRPIPTKLQSSIPVIKGNRKAIPILLHQQQGVEWKYIDAKDALNVFKYLSRNGVAANFSQWDDTKNSWVQVAMSATQQYNIPPPVQQVYDDPLVKAIETSMTKMMELQQSNNTQLMNNIIEQQRMTNESMMNMMSTFQQTVLTLMQEKGNDRGRSPQSRRAIQQAYDDSIPEISLPFRVEELAERNYPNIYSQAYNRRDYNPENWTYSLARHSPLYITPSHRPAELYMLKVAVTPKVEEIWNTRDYQNRFNNPSNTDYQSMRPSEVIRIVNQELGIDEVQEEPYITTTTSLPVQRRLMTDMIHRHIDDPSTITLDITYTPSSEAISKNTYEQLYPEDTRMDVIQNSTTYFDGMVTIHEMEIPIGITIIDKYLDIVYQSLARLASTDIDMDTQSPIIYWVQAYYTSYDDNGALNGESKVGIWNGTAEQVATAELRNLSMSLSQTLSDLGYEEVSSNNNLSLDMSRFVIKRIQFIRTGRGKSPGSIKKSSLQDILSSKKLTSFHDFHGSYTLPWGVIYGVKSAHNICFQQALNYFLKNVTKTRPAASTTTKAYDIRNLMKENQVILEAGRRPIDIIEALNIGNSFGYHTFVHGIDGSILGSSYSEVLPNTMTNTPAPVEDKDREFHVMLADGHYVNILEFLVTPTPVIEENVSSKDISSKDKYFYDTSLVFYDIETVVTETNEVIPYANAYKINGMVGLSISPVPSRNVFNDMISKIQSMGPGLLHYLIAYNGANFDHIQLYKYLLQRGFKVIKSPNPKGKGQSFLILIKTDNKGDSWREELIRTRVSNYLNTNSDISSGRRRKAIEKINKIINNGYSILTIWDPVLYIRTSLSKAAESFKLPVKKESFSHVEVQDAYESGTLEEWLDENNVKLREYNIRDVEVLEGLTYKLFEALEDITGMNMDKILRISSISGLSYKWWKELTNNDKFDYKPVAKEGIDKAIRSSLIAGRTEGILGEHVISDDEYPFVLVDVVSLYPTVMEMYEYPVGEETLLASVQEAIESYNNGIIGLYYCRWNQESMKGKTNHPILPVRGEDGRLNWHDFSQGQGYLPSITISQLLEYGAVVDMLIPTNTITVSTSKKFNDMNEARNYVSKLDTVYEIRKKGNELYVISTSQVLVTAIVWNNKGKPFLGYVELLKDRKNEQDEYASNKDDRYNPALREMIKMLLNSLSGKVLQRNFNNHYRFISNADELYKGISDLFGIPTSSDELNLLVSKYKLDIEPLVIDVQGNEYANMLWIEDDYSINRAKPSQLGVFIYAYARYYMYKEVFSRCKVYYSDTDSALITLEDYGRYINPALRCLDIGDNWELVKVRNKKFGDLELEIVNGVYLYTKAVVIAPKTYALYNGNKIVKWRCKGVRKTDKFIYTTSRGDELLSIMDNVELFYDVLLNNMINEFKTEIHTWSFGKHWGKGLGVDMIEVVKLI